MSAARDAARDALAALREDFASWITEPDLSRALIAQCDLVTRWLDADDYDSALAGVQMLQAAHRAAGHRALGAGL